MIGPPVADMISRMNIAKIGSVLQYPKEVAELFANHIPERRK